MEWLNKNSDALMVIITFVYVIATIFIWRANNKSAKASKEQLEESKRQFEETKRLGIMPYLSVIIKTTNSNGGYVELDITDSSDKKVDFSNYKLSIENVGNSIAKSIQIEFVSELAFLKRQSVYSIDFLPAGRDDVIGVCFAGEVDTIKNEQSISNPLIISFEDVFCNKYQQQIELVFRYRDGIQCSIGNISSPTLIKKGIYNNV